MFSRRQMQIVYPLNVVVLQVIMIMLLHQLKVIIQDLTVTSIVSDMEHILILYQQVCILTEDIT